jgi:hypothetical protein
MLSRPVIIQAFLLIFELALSEQIKWIAKIPELVRRAIGYGRFTTDGALKRCISLVRRARGDQAERARSLSKPGMGAAIASSRQ